MNADNLIKALLVQKAWREDHCNAIHGLHCCVYIVRNRVRAGWGSWLSVLQHYEDYAGNPPGPLQEYPNLNDPLFRQLLNGIDAIYDGKELDQMTSAKDPLNGTVTTALYFADLNKPMTEFFKTKILGDKENHRLCGKCGTLTLFN